MTSERDNPINPISLNEPAVSEPEDTNEPSRYAQFDQAVDDLVAYYQELAVEHIPVTDLSDLISIGQVQYQQRNGEAEDVFQSVGLKLNMHRYKINKFYENAAKFALFNLAVMPRNGKKARQLHLASTDLKPSLRALFVFNEWDENPPLARQLRKGKGHSSLQNEDFQTLLLLAQQKFEPKPYE